MDTMIEPQNIMTDESQINQVQLVPQEKAEEVDMAVDSSINHEPVKETPQSVEAESVQLSEEPSHKDEEPVVAEIQHQQNDQVLVEQATNSPPKLDQNNQNSSNNSFDLNMSSVSEKIEADEVSKEPGDEPGLEKSPCNSPNLILPDDGEFNNNRTMSRTSSMSSLFSHISSVSQHFDTNEVATPTNKKRGRPSKKAMPHLMDDNELSVKKANEEAFESKCSGKSSTIRRRNSDLSSSSSSSSAASTANIEAVARLRANLQQIPATFGTSDHEVRVTRSKLRSIIEHTESGNEQTPQKATPAKRVTRRASKKVLEQVNEQHEETMFGKMSIGNLRKHNAALEKMDVLASLAKPIDEAEMVAGKKKTPRVTRSVVSPTASSVASTVLSTASTTAIKTQRKTSRKSVKSKQDEQADDKTICGETSESEVEINSPTNSLASCASSTYKTRSNTKSSDKLVKTDSGENARKYNLRSKGKTAQLIDEIEKRTQTPSSTLTRKPRVKHSNSVENGEPADSSNYR